MPSTKYAGLTGVYDFFLQSSPLSAGFEDIAHCQEFLAMANGVHTGSTQRALTCHRRRRIGLNNWDDKFLKSFDKCLGTLDTSRIQYLSYVQVQVEFKLSQSATRRIT